MKKVSIQLQYFKGCPNVFTLLENIKTAIIGIEDKVKLTEIVINSNELANELKFRGSPTLLINGIDLEYMPEPINVSLSCRVYNNCVPSVENIKSRIVDEICKIELKEE